MRTKEEQDRFRAGDDVHEKTIFAELFEVVFHRFDRAVSIKFAGRGTRTDVPAILAATALPFFPSNAIYDRSTAIFPRSMSFTSSIVAFMTYSSRNKDEDADANAATKLASVKSFKSHTYGNGPPQLL